MSFWLRELLWWSWPVAPPRGGRLRREGAAGQRLAELAEKYRVQDLPPCCGEIELAESLYTLDILDRYMPPLHIAEQNINPARDFLRTSSIQDISVRNKIGLDVGCKSGATLPGLHVWAPGWDGIELDAHRRYWMGHTRRAVGEAVAARLPGSRYLAGDVRSLRGRYQRITWFLPFLFPEPLEAWGLPARYLAPEQTLAHVLSLLEPGGFLLILNQGEEEADEQGRLLQAAGAPAEALGKVESLLSPYKKSRYGWRVGPAPQT
jgi:hypothetical protein